MNIQNPKGKEKILKVSMKRKETSTYKSVINQVNIKNFWQHQWMLKTMSLKFWGQNDFEPITLYSDKQSIMHKDMFSDMGRLGNFT